MINKTLKKMYVTHLFLLFYSNEIPCHFCRQKAIGFYHRSTVEAAAHHSVDQIQFHTRIYLDPI